MPLIKKMEKNTKKEIIWEDHGSIETLRKVLLYSPSLILLIIFFLFEGFLEKVFFGVLFLLSLSLIYIQANRKLSSIKRNGINLGNLTLKKWSTFEKNQSKLFLPWRLVKNIGIVNKAHTTPKLSVLRKYVILKTDKGRKFKFLIYDSQGFIQALKKLNKYHLLSKDSKYR